MGPHIPCMPPGPSEPWPCSVRAWAAHLVRVLKPCPSLPCDLLAADLKYLLFSHSVPQVSQALLIVLSSGHSHSCMSSLHHGRELTLTQPPRRSCNLSWLPHVLHLGCGVVWVVSWNRGILLEAICLSFGFIAVKRHHDQGHTCKENHVIGAGLQVQRIIITMSGSIAVSKQT